MEWQNIRGNMTEKQWTTFIVFTFTFATLTSLASLMFLLINAVLVHALCSRPAFMETPRYVLLLNMVLADSVVLFLGQYLYLHTALRVYLSYPLCGFYTMIAGLSVQISPLTLTVMSVERYIAVCFPFHHATLVTMRNTTFTILGVWALGCMNIFVRGLLLVDFPFHTLPSLQMNFPCSVTAMQLSPRFKDYETAGFTLLFLFSGLVIVVSFIGVMVVALSASKDQASAAKARSTLLLHMFQLCLNLLALMGQPINSRLIAETSRAVIGQLLVVIYIFVVMMPRCLSSLTYGLKDPSIRAVLVVSLFCRWKHKSPVRNSI